MEAQLIEAVKKRPVLYDSKCTGYNDPKMKVDAWNSIASEFKLSPRAGEPSLYLCHMWNNLVRLHKDFIRKRKGVPTASASQADVVFFPHEKEMEFFTEYYEPQSEKNVPIELVEDEESGGEQGLPLQFNPSFELKMDNFPDCGTNTRKRPHAAIGVTMDEQILKTLVESITTGQEEEDEFDLYCSSLVPKFRRIAETDPRSAALIQVKIHQLFFDTEFNDTA